jgi:peptide deformylase
MAVRNILKLGDPTLKKKCKPVAVFDEKLAKLLDDLLDTLHKEDGLGLASPQVGILKRAFIVEYDNVLYECVNPEVVDQSGSCTDNEGCLSVKGFRGLVERPEKITLRYFDREGNEQTIEAEGYFARVFLHELDHLNGILFSDIMTQKIIEEE